MNAALVVSHQQNHFLAPSNAEHEAEQAASTSFQDVGLDRLGIETIVRKLVALLNQLHHLSDQLPYEQM